MRPYILAETNWENMNNAKIELAVLPWGATEAHNFHLPYATDNYEADLMAAESARIAWENGSKVIVLPTVPFGVIVEMLNRQKVYKLLIFNSHGGNNFKSMIRELGLKYPKMFISLTNWFSSLDRSLYFDDPGYHADEMETSLLLHLKPDLVLPKDKWGEGKEKKNKIKAIKEGWVWSERKWSQISEDTGVGNPKLATKEKGERYFKAVTTRMGALFSDLCNADIQNLYE